MIGTISKLSTIQTTIVILKQNNQCRFNVQQIHKYPQKYKNVVILLSFDSYSLFVDIFEKPNKILLKSDLKMILLVPP